MCLGSGIGNLEDLYDTSFGLWERGEPTIIHCESDGLLFQQKNYRKIHPLFVPRLLINLGAAHISLRYGLKVRFSTTHFATPLTWSGSKPCSHDGLHHRSPFHRRRSSLHHSWRCRHDDCWRSRILHPSSGFRRICQITKSDNGLQ